MSRRARAVAPLETTPPAPAAPPSQQYRHTLYRRLRSLLAELFFEGLSTAGRLTPLGNPKRHGVEVESDVLYGPHADWHQLDIYRPVKRPKPWAVMFYVHGGAFHLLSKDTHWLMGLVFARFGYLVVNISYRLAPKHPFPGALEDTCAAYRWLAARITDLVRKVSESEVARDQVIAQVQEGLREKNADLNALRRTKDDSEKAPNSLLGIGLQLAADFAANPKP